MLSTVQDLVRLGVAINANVLMSPGSVATMHRLQLEEIRLFTGDGPTPEGPTGQAGVMAVMAVADTAQFDILRQQYRRY